MSPIGAITDRGLSLFGLVTFVTILIAALHNVSQAYDGWYYHMPFAARIVGIVTPETFIFHAPNEERFKGFPLFAELIQGLLWRLSGRAECANLFSFASIPLFAWFLRRWFGVAAAITVLALLAVPLVHIHASTLHVDLPASAATAVLGMLTIRAYVSTEAPGPKLLGLAAAAAALAAHTKVVVHPMVLAFLGALFGRALWLRRSLPATERRRYSWVLAACVLAAFVIFANPLRNTIVHHNPYYPHRLQILGHEFEGAEVEYSSSPAWLADVPRPVRFAASVLELGLRPLGRLGRWSVDQWTRPDDPGLRSGGFFGVYAAAHVLLLSARVFFDRSRQNVRVTSGFALVTLFTSVLPQSHELRYYMYWMLMLVSLNLWLASEPGPAWLGARTFGLLSLPALAIVVWNTRGSYTFPIGKSFDELVARWVPDRELRQIPDGGTVCILREPYNLLWAAPFHPTRHSYRIQSAEKNQPAQCNGYPIVEDRSARRKKSRPRK